MSEAHDNTAVDSATEQNLLHDLLLDDTQGVHDPSLNGAGTAPASSLLDSMQAEVAGAAQSADADNPLTLDSAGLAAVFDALGIEVRYNDRIDNVEVRLSSDDLSLNLGFHGVDPAAWRVLGDKHRLVLLDLIQRKFVIAGRKKSRLPMRFSEQSFNQAFTALAAPHSVDPVRQWLESLPEWDGVERLELVLVDALDLPDTPLVRFVGQGILVGAIDRTYRPGCLRAIVPTFIGATQKGKSAFCWLLLPEDHWPDSNDPWFSDNVNLMQDTRERVEIIGPALIVEVAELAGMPNTTAGINKLKAFLSSSVDRCRGAYRRNSEAHPRAWIPIGTANDSGVGVLPDDPTGNMRWVALEIGPNCCWDRVKPYMDANRDQLWAEALYRYHSVPPGMRSDLHKIPDSLRAEQQEANDRQTPVDEGVRSMAERITVGYRSGQHKMVSMLVEYGPFRDIADAEVNHYALSKRLGPELRRMGWTTVRPYAKTGTPRSQLWIPPEELPEGMDEVDVAGDRVRRPSIYETAEALIRESFGS